MVYSPKKIKLAKLNFHEDKLEGLCVFFNLDGLRVKEAVYENNCHNGWGREYKDDSIVFEGLYQNGKRYSELKLFSKNLSFLREMKDGQTLSICQFNENHKRDGLCYCYSNNAISSVVLYENGVKKRKVREFIRELMIEYNEDEQIVYRGQFEGNIISGFVRKKIGWEYHYTKGKITEMIGFLNGVVTSKCILDGDLMMGYTAKNQLLYEGCYNSKDMFFLYHGRGIKYITPDHFCTSEFENGKEVKRFQEMNGSVMIETDEKGRVSYKGGFSRKCGIDDRGSIKQTLIFNRSGTGLLFEYSGMNVKEVYGCENGEKTYKRSDFKDKIMSEYNWNGGLEYQGGFIGNPTNGFLRNGEGDTFDIDEMLVYSGHWSKGKREGNGKYYHNGDLIYNGMWASDKPNGKGKVYNSDGVVKQEGEWKNGFLEVDRGIWIEYENGRLCILYKNGEKKYEGELKNRKPEGKGEYFNKEGKILYEGEWKNGEIEIEPGVFFCYETRLFKVIENGSVKYEGGWKNNQPEGKGTIFIDNEKYNGLWKNGILELSHNVFLNYKTNLITVKNGDGSIKYEGGWNFNHPYKQGVYEEKGEWKYNGEWSYGKPEGHGTFSDGEGNIIYEGEWKSGKPDGKGTLYENGSVKYNGEWKNGKCIIKNGVWYDYGLDIVCIDSSIMNDYHESIEVCVYYLNNCFFKGGWKNGSANGYGEIINSNGDVIKGEWENGILMLDNNSSLEMEGTSFYVNALQKTGLFGCRMKRGRKKYTVKPIVLEAKRNCLSVPYITLFPLVDL